MSTNTSSENKKKKPLIRTKDSAKFLHLDKLSPERKSPENFRGFIIAMTANPSGSLIVTAHNDNEIGVSQVPNPSNVTSAPPQLVCKIEKAHTHRYIRCVVFVNDTDFLSGATDHKVVFHRQKKKIQKEGEGEAGTQRLSWESEVLFESKQGDINDMQIHPRTGYKNPSSLSSSSSPVIAVAVGRRSLTDEGFPIIEVDLEDPVKKSIVRFIDSTFFTGEKSKKNKMTNEWMGCGWSSLGTRLAVGGGETIFVFDTSASCCDPSAGWTLLRVFFHASQIPASLLSSAAKKLSSSSAAAGGKKEESEKEKEEEEEEEHKFDDISSGTVQQVGFAPGRHHLRRSNATGGNDDDDLVIVGFDTGDFCAVYSLSQPEATSSSSAGKAHKKKKEGDSDDRSSSSSDDDDNDEFPRDEPLHRLMKPLELKKKTLGHSTLCSMIVTPSSVVHGSANGYVYFYSLSEIRSPSSSSIIFPTEIVRVDEKEGQDETWGITPLGRGERNIAFCPAISLYVMKHPLGFSKIAARLVVFLVKEKGNCKLSETLREIYNVNQLVCLFAPAGEFDFSLVCKKNSGSEASGVGSNFSAASGGSVEFDFQEADLKQREYDYYTPSGSDDDFTGSYPTTDEDS